MEKYYTPEIEEFHVGFEYEIQFLDQGDVRTTSILFNGDIKNKSELKRILKQIGV